MIKCWVMGGECLHNPPIGFYGFLYKITDNLGRVYFGKKAFEHNQKKKISKKVRKISGTRKRVERVKKDSGWLDYYGSSKPFIAYLDELPDRRDMCKREIIKLCKDKTSLAYHETKLLIEQNVLFRDDCWNGNISGRFFKGKIHE